MLFSLLAYTHSQLLAGRTYSCRNLQQYVRHMFFIFKRLYSCTSIFYINLTSNILIYYMWLVFYHMFPCYILIQHNMSMTQFDITKYRWRMYWSSSSNCLFFCSWRASGRLFVAQVLQECRLHHLVCVPYVIEMSRKVRNRIILKDKKEVF